MANKTTGTSITNILKQFYSYTFSDTPSYYFIVPSGTDTTPATITHKVQHCIECNGSVNIPYENRGEIYIDNSKIAQQRQLYLKYDQAFPAIEDNQPLIYLQEGYCAKCFPLSHDAQNGNTQSIYTLCSQLMQLDIHLETELMLLSQQALQQVDTFHLRGDDMQWLKQLLVEYQPIQAYLQQQQQLRQELVTTITHLLTQINSPYFKAYVGRPMNVLETMSSTLCNEYTIVIPDKTVPDDYFFIQSSIKAEKVITFLNLPRLTNIEQFLNQPGVANSLVSSIDFIHDNS